MIASMEGFIDFRMFFVRNIFDFGMLLMQLPAACGISRRKVKDFGMLFDAIAGRVSNLMLDFRLKIIDFRTLF